MDDMKKPMALAMGGLKVSMGRMRVAATNLANAQSTSPDPGGEPFRRKLSTFTTEMDKQLGQKVVKMGPIKEDMSPFISRYEPGHPAADANGYVLYPNVKTLIEMNDANEAMLNYNANISVISTTKQIIMETLTLLKE